MVSKNRSSLLSSFKGEDQLDQLIDLKLKSPIIHLRVYFLLSDRASLISKASLTYRFCWTSVHAAKQQNVVIFQHELMIQVS